MDSEVRLYLQRAEDEFLLAEKDMDISIDSKLKDILNISRDKTFFNSVITHSYYSIFYSAKAYLLSLGIITKPPEEHKKTYEGFKRLVKSGKLDRQLLQIYEYESEKAEVLLNIFYLEKKKRGIFTYHLKSEANIPSAKESISNARKFVANIKNILEKG